MRINLKKSKTKIKVRKKMPKPTVAHNNPYKMSFIDGLKHKIKMLNKRLTGNDSPDID